MKNHRLSFVFMLAAWLMPWHAGLCSGNTLLWGDFALQFVECGDTYRSFGICISHRGKTVFRQDCPMQVVVYNPQEKDLHGVSAFYAVPYHSLEETDNGFSASGVLSVPDGSMLRFEDVYRKEDGMFVVDREVNVVRAAEEGKGYATVFSLQAENKDVGCGNYEYFIPSVLYRNTSQMPPHAIASGLDGEKMYVKETRTGIPMAMLRDTASHIQLTLLHDPDIQTNGCPDGGKPGIVDNRIAFGSIGYGLNPCLSVDFRFPCAEGPQTYEWVPENARGDSPWVNRYHKLCKGAEQHYTLALMPDCQTSFQNGMQQAFMKAFGVLYDLSTVPDISMDSIYADNIFLFQNEYKEYGTGTVRAAGLPWSLDLPDGGNSEGVSFQMGFVGQQIAVGYHLLRYGLDHDNADAIKKGKTMVDFWTSDAIMGTYFPTVWWDPANNNHAGTRREYPSFLRCMVDGMEGLLDACRIAGAYGDACPQWENALQKVASHLVEKQEPDGSFRRAYNTRGDVERGGDRNTAGLSKLNTPIAVRFLAKMYEHTGLTVYKTAALKAADYAYRELYQHLGKYVGGTPDNPNTVDKEAAVYALYAFNAAHSLSGDNKYLEAAGHAACCAMSWVYCYDFALPCRNDKEQRINPFSNGGIAGFSIIATGHSGADNFMAYAYYEMYKLYVKTGNPIYRDMAYFLQNNTKSCTDFDGRMGYKYRAFMPEATNVADMGFRSVAKWLPWSGIANIEPIVQMEETFGTNNILHIRLDMEQLREALDNYGCGGKPLKRK